MYKGKAFHVKPVDKVFGEIASIPARFTPHVNRIFLADGDALVYPFDGLTQILDRLMTTFPNLTRVGSYASPQSLSTKSARELEVLREKKLRMLYFGLESGDDATLAEINKGFSTAQMAAEAAKARQCGMKLSVTAILGLAGRLRSIEHARKTAAWVNEVNPEFFSLLTLFYRHNDDFLRNLQQCTRGELLHEAHELLSHLHPQKTILRSNHVSNFLHLSGSYPKDRERLIMDAEAALADAARIPGYLDEVPDYQEDYY